MTLHGFRVRVRVRVQMSAVYMCTNVPKFGLETVIALLLIVFAIALATRSLLRRMLVARAVLSPEEFLCIQTVGRSPTTLHANVLTNILQPTMQTPIELEYTVYMINER